MKYITILIVLTVLAYPRYIEYSPLDEAIYDLVTDCNGYYPMQSGWHQFDCE